MLLSDQRRRHCSGLTRDVSCALSAPLRDCTPPPETRSVSADPGTPQAPGPVSHPEVSTQVFASVSNFTLQHLRLRNAVQKCRRRKKYCCCCQGHGQVCLTEVNTALNPMAQNTHSPSVTRTGDPLECTALRLESNKNQKARTCVCSSQKKRFCTERQTNFSLKVRKTVSRKLKTRPILENYLSFGILAKDRSRGLKCDRTCGNAS